MIVDFTADWCLPCNALDEEVFQAPGWRRCPSGCRGLYVL